ncbi:MAG: phenylalanine--tRNA ligase subunit beta [Candidatus Micrarchaeales archaeon]
MTVSKYNKEYLARRLGFKVDDKELFRNINKMGLSIDRTNKDEIDIEFPANRPDLISTIGLARAIRYFMRRSRKFEYKLGMEENEFIINVGANVGKIRPFISGLVVRNMKLGEDDLLEIINFTEKLSETYGRKREQIALGLHDLKNVKPPFYYDAYENEEFVPLEKRNSMRYSEVIERESKGNEYGRLCKMEQRYVALKDMHGTMSLIPVLNSERTKVSATTKNMLVDITGVNKYAIEKTADLLAADFADMGYEVSRIRVNYNGSVSVIPKMRGGRISIPVDQIEKEIGVEIGPNNSILLANKMGYEASRIGTKIRLEVPPYRLDVINEQDVIEDIAIAYGYDYIRPIPVPSAQAGNMERISKETERISELMAGLGFSEMMNSYLTNEDMNFKSMRLEKHDDYIAISNPKTENMTMLRTWLLPSLMRNLSRSMHDKLPINIFELDMAFGLKGDATEERYHLAAVTCDAHANFNDAKSAVEGLAKRLGIAFEFKRARHESFIEGRCAEIMLDKKNIGFLGEIHPEVLISFGIEEPVTAFEIDLNKMTL